MTPNMLAQWLQFYDQNMGGQANTHGDSPWSGTFSRDQSAATEAGARMAFAQHMAGQQDGGQDGGSTNRMPDYFAGVPQGNPQAGPGVGMGPMAPQQGYNRLAMLMGRR